MAYRTKNARVVRVAGIPGRAGVDGTDGLDGAPGQPGTTTVAGLTDATAVGKAIATATFRAIANTDTTAASSDTYVAITALTAARTVTLPSAAAFPRGKVLYVADESGNCSSTWTITIAAQGSDTIAGQSSVTMASAYQKLAFHSNGANLWTYA